MVQKQLTDSKTKGTLVFNMLKSTLTSVIVACSALLLLFSFSSLAKENKYLIILNPGDCFKCALQFTDLQSFLNNNEIKPTIITPFSTELDAKFLLEKFQFSYDKIKLEINPSKYKKFNKKSTYSYIFVINDNKIIFEQLIALLDTNKIPVIEKISPVLTSKLTHSNPNIPYYANDLIVRSNEKIIHNGIYNKLFYTVNNTFAELNLDSQILEIVLSNEFLGDEKSKQKNINLLKEYKLTKIKFQRLSSSRNLWAIAEIPILTEDKSTYNTIYYLVSFDESLSIKSCHKVFHDCHVDNVKFWSAFIFDFNIHEETNRLFLFLTRGQNNALYDKGDSSYYVLGEYKLIDNAYVFEKLHKNKLPRYQIDKEHYYRNLWGLMDMNNNVGGIFGFQYLNEIGFLNGETIWLQDLKTDKLILPYEPGGKSNKPFEIIKLRYKHNLIQVIVWRKGYTWLHVYTAKGHLLKKHKLIKSPIKPAVYLNKNEIHLLNGTMKGELEYYKFELQ